MANKRNQHEIEKMDDNHFFTKMDKLYNNNSSNSNQDQVLFSYEKNNISFYQSKQLSSIDKKYPISSHNIICTKFPISKEKQRVRSPISTKINLTEYFNQKENQIKKRSIKTYQNKFDIQKSIHFNVLSHKKDDIDEEDVEEDYAFQNNYILRKQYAGGLFFPSKKARSPLPSNYSMEGWNKLMTYQTPTLKFQSFFGTFNQENGGAKKKKNKLEDFNIDKLIEIGDNYNIKWKPISAFSKNSVDIKLNNKLLKNHKSFTKRSKNINNLQFKLSTNVKKISHVQIKRKKNTNELKTPKNNKTISIKCLKKKDNNEKGDKNRVIINISNKDKDNKVDKKFDPKVSAERRKIIFGGYNNNVKINFKEKRYYGYDDRHNLESNMILNHSYYESIYTKKKNDTDNA